MEVVLAIFERPMRDNTAWPVNTTGDIWSIFYSTFCCDFIIRNAYVDFSRYFRLDLL